MRAQPLFSLVLPVKNGLPHVRKTIDALRCQTYRNFELIVQDGGSTDGSVAYLQSISDFGRVDVVSQPDTGIGQAYNRGMSRARGDLVCLIASDECLDADALQKGVAWFSQYPDAASIYGGARLADAGGHIIEVFIPPAFDLMAVLKNEMVIPACAAFFNREKIGDDFYYDETLTTCPDYEFWIRLGSRFGPSGIVRVPDPIVVARADRTSMSFRAEAYNQYCKDKLSILDRFLRARGNDPEIAELRKTASAGILTWAAETVFRLEGASPAFFKWCQEAAAFDPQSERLLRLARRTQAFEIDPLDGQFTPRRNIQPDHPTGETDTANGVLSLDDAETFSYWEGASVERDGTLRVVTGPVPWGYAARIPLSAGDSMEPGRLYWAKLDVQVISGQIGIALYADDELCNERLISSDEGRTSIFVRLSEPAATAVMIRNGSLPERSVVKIFEANVESCRI